MVEKYKALPIHGEPVTEANDSVLAMLGVGKQLWDSEPGDSFVERLRSEPRVVASGNRTSSKDGGAS